MKQRNQRLSALAPIPNFYRIRGSRFTGGKRYYRGTIRGASYKLTRRFGVWFLSPVNAPNMPAVFGATPAIALRRVLFKTSNRRTDS